ncbi:DeoR family transcriptional regulator [Pseudactinotalea sp. HY160]|nr:substrate-binding domain-containing protein [Pseudactinotalea sp. HY160]MPV48485.1 DeoR family transcriptional regulator [Pseudactinotalea sp. HY160]
MVPDGRHWSSILRVSDDRGTAPRLAGERREAIAALARMHGVVRVSELADRYGVSHVTIRRDISALVDRGALTRIHGGARSTAGMVRAAAGDDQVRIGVILPASRYYFRELLEGIREGAARAGIAVVLAISEYDDGEERRLFERMLRAKVAGVLLATAAAEPETGWLDSSPVPVVLVERAGPAFDHARSDHEDGARIAVAHLVARGHERIMLAACSTTPTAARLLAGYRAELAAAGRDLLEPFDLPGEDASPTGRRARLHDLLRACAQQRASALILHPEGFALPLLEAAEDRAVAVPADLALVTYDDELAEFASIPLTAVQPPKRDVGSIAVDVLVRRLTRPGVARQRVTLLPRLVVRESS